jgi:hypothetical protein
MLSHVSTNLPSSSGCTLLGSHSIVSEDSGLLVCGVASFGELTSLPLKKDVFPITKILKEHKEAIPICCTVLYVD